MALRAGVGSRYRGAVRAPSQARLKSPRGKPLGLARGARGMTAVERVRRTQRILGAAAVTRALAWGLAATLAIVATISFSVEAIPRLRDDSALYDVFALVLGAVVAAVLLWRSRH